ARNLGVTIRPQWAERLSDGEYTPTIKPDILVLRQGKIAAIIDAKYKQDADGPVNSDLFQVVTYGTALDCTRTFLFYPDTEISIDRSIRIRNSPIVVNTRCVAVAGSHCVASAEHSARLAIE